MFDSTLLFIATALLLAGFVKGALGLGLPTVAMGLLAVSMAPAQAIAIVIVPAIVTNIWQTFGGPYLRDIIRRLWPLLIGTAAGIWLNAGSLTGPYARYTTIALGLLLVGHVPSLTYATVVPSLLLIVVVGVAFTRWVEARRGIFD